MRLRLTARNSPDSPNFFHLVRFFVMYKSVHLDFHSRRTWLFESKAISNPDTDSWRRFARLLELSGLRLIGRNYYQFDRKIDLERYRLTLFPGFLTNVNIYEGSLMINVDLSHKVRLISVFSVHSLDCRDSGVEQNDGFQSSSRHFHPICRVRAVQRMKRKAEACRTKILHF